MMRLCSALLFAVLVGACATIPSPQERRAQADALAQARGWQRSVIAADSFNLVVYGPRQRDKADSLTVYIEGDGFAWVTGSTPSADPTPRDPLALRLALAQAVGSAAYLARPCQYVDAGQTGCAERYWTEARFAQEVIDAENQVLDVLKQRVGASRLTLVGYSGGAAVAALLSARRNDVTKLVSVAGNLDHQAWRSTTVSYHSLTQ